jgi:antibiotic biosynthesis monooxygenase (ABM) superfamily enzyme
VSTQSIPVQQPEHGVAAPVAPSTPSAPSVHLRAFVTWLAIFPLVALGLTIMGPFVQEWPPVLRAFALTIILVPLAVYVVIPPLMRLAVRVVRR